MALSTCSQDSMSSDMLFWNQIQNFIMFTFLFPLDHVSSKAVFTKGKRSQCCTSCVAGIKKTRGEGEKPACYANVQSPRATLT